MLNKGSSDSLLDLVSNIDSLLKLTYVETDLGIIVQESIDTLSSIFECDFNTSTLDEVIGGTLFSSSDTLPFKKSLIHLMEKLSYYNTSARFNTTTDVSLKRAGYLGFAQSSLRAALSMLQTHTIKNQEGDLENITKSFTVSASRLETCLEKRLIAILLVLMRLGYWEGTACVAETLYVGCYV